MSSLDTSDLTRFASVVMRLSTKKGFLTEVKRGSELERGFYCLFGNLLYCFESESDANSVKGFVFLESSTCKVSTNISSSPMLSVSTVGGRTVNFTAKDMSDLYEWLSAIESSKLVNMNRRLDDSETSLVALRHKVEHLEELQIEHERTYVEMKKELESSKEQIATAQSDLERLTAEKAQLEAQLKSIESERLLLLKSRGITPKRIPQWAAPDEQGEEVKLMKLWVGTWNLQGREPFPAMDRDRSRRLLKAFVPLGYDMYIVGLQECPNDSLFESVDSLLEGEGFRRLQWTINNHNTSSYFNNLNTTISEASSADPSKHFGKGKESQRGHSFLTIGVYVRNKFASDVSILSIASEGLSGGGNDCVGAIAMALKVHGRVIAVVNSLLDGKSNETRRDQYQHLFMELGSKLAEGSYHLNEQFHHVIWMGDLNHRLVDTSGNPLPLESAVKMLEDGRVMRTLFDSHDELNRDKKQQLIFFNFREASPYPNFYPTYRRIRNRPPVDYQSSSWVRNTYVLSEKGSFFKGGKMKEYTPGFCDRILYYSMADVAEDLIPEPSPADLEIQGDGRSGAAGDGANGSDGGANRSMRTTITIDNYKAINDGEGMTVSEHAPVTCTFLLRLCHDHDASPLTSKRSMGDIKSMFNALTIPETPDRATCAAAGLSSGGSTLGATGKPPYTPDNFSAGKSVLETPPRSGSAAPMSKPSISLPLRGSLLPMGVYRVRVSGMRLIWGMNESFPVRVSLLFPTPYEAVAGDRFVDFTSEALPSPVGNKSFSGSFSTNGAPGSLNGSAPNRNSKRLQHTNSANKGDPQWKNSGPTKTGTCIALESGRSIYEYHQPGSNAIPPVVLTWRGEEPLDRLHIALKVTMMTSTIRSGRALPPAGGGKSGGSGSNDLEEDDVMLGHCALSLEQLCKVAVSNAGDGYSVSATRMLVCRGRPMYCVDPQTMQREVVSFHCKLELIQ